MTTCQPDIAFTSVKLSQSNSRPAEIHYHGLKHAIRYLYTTRTDGHDHNANRIFGPDLAQHVRVDYLEIPRDIIDMHKYVTLVADVMFVNGLPFLVSSSRKISLVTIEYLPSQTAKRLSITLELS